MTIDLHGGATPRNVDSGYPEDSTDYSWTPTTPSFPFAAIVRDKEAEASICGHFAPA
jgi:hypothetical protein